MKCMKLLSKPSTNYWGSMKCTKFVMDEADLSRTLNMNTPVFALSQF